MTETLTLPTILDIPDKMLPIIDEFNNYSYFVAEGGRNGSKTQAVGRLLLYLAEQKKLRIVCGRETQNRIEESVYSVMADLIRSYNLNFEVLAQKITHRDTGTDINFRGFREQGAFNIQGMEGVDIVWIDEAQAITKLTLDKLVPTIRKENSKIFFTMNRFLRNDPVYDMFVGRDDCLHIYINYLDNQFCPEKALKEAEECRLRNIDDYQHIWLGKPLDQAEDYFFNFAKLDKTNVMDWPQNDLYKDSVMGVDLSGSGGDMCVASLLQRRSDVHWELIEQRSWNDKDTDSSVGKIINLRADWNPTATVVDKGGMGYPMYVSLQKTIKDILGFDGSGEATIVNSGNQRADGYIMLKDIIDNECLALGKYESTIKELETIKRKFKANGLVFMQSKQEMVKSPDRADSLMMAIWAINNGLQSIKNKNKPKTDGYRSNRKERSFMAA